MTTSINIILYISRNSTSAFIQNSKLWSMIKETRHLKNLEICLTIFCYIAYCYPLFFTSTQYIHPILLTFPTTFTFQNIQFIPFKFCTFESYTNSSSTTFLFYLDPFFNSDRDHFSFILRVFPSFSTDFD